ncbi:protein-S-isoprenylcysteine O-methyltransferase [[Emmonsia] crescens]|uniref:Protein-S-isoprenylcysteine O-methyltransferase n=1 Tax=[Emmonsia] crescens TaxID=73230 RepID=A0A0G2J0K5_9EURO|nr:protein-S-isoprenylcysteine O-methyltransferase [Emmonsia crescens UAMH 3008]
MEHGIDASTSSISPNHLDSPPIVTDPPSTGVDWRPRREYVSYRPERDDNGATTKTPREVDPAILPGGKKSLAGISIRSFVLGQVFGLCIVLSLILLKSSNPLWRAPFFLTSLSLFHFLEYYITARYSTPYASISAFLLSSNGAAYNLAHTSALAECLLSRLVLPEGYVEWTSLAFGGVKMQIGLGLVFMAVGQVVRSLAMVQAGTNFTHTVQSRRREGHTLVKDGIYSILRHPSYFGFFWWGLGTQLVLGNAICFFAYAIVLWKFFSSRIHREEKFLIGFFDKEYIEYRKTVRVGIPFIS